MDTVIEKLIDTGFEYLKDQVRWQTGMKEELERLRDTQYPRIKAVVAYASTQLEITDEALNNWLWKLRNAIDEAEDLLDVFEYMKLEKEELAKKKNKANSIGGKVLKVGQRALKIDPNLKKLEKVVQKLDEVSAGAGDFLRLVEEAKQEYREQQQQQRQQNDPGSLPQKNLIGRGNNYKENVLRWVNNPSNENQSLITGRFENISLKSIVGHGGMGKTTLLQHVFEEDRIEESYSKMWVYVSDNFDVSRVIADMLESLTKERPRLESSLHILQESLKSALKSEKFKKFLLVLDDIWTADDLGDKLEKVLAPLASVKLGSKILVTTRMDSVASMIADVMGKKNEHIKLEGLNEDECLQLLNNHAFHGVGILYDRETILRPIAKEIVEKLSGSPLVAKVIGADLKENENEEYWKTFLNNDIGSDAPFWEKVLKVLRRSYNILTRTQKICFAFCSIFPQNHEFDKDDLVRMWIALSFIHSTEGMTRENIRGDDFNVLVNKSLFDKFQTKDKRTYYKMHDLIRELALSVSKQECLSIVGDEMLNSDNFKSIRHLSVETSNLEVLRSTKKLRNLRSLFLYYKGKVDLDAEIFKAWRSIRLLYIYAPNQKLTLPIGHLIHVRYLKLVKTSVTLLPSSLRNLYLLRFIIYDRKAWSFHENFLPRDFNNLNLHHLQLPWDKFPVIHGIGKLSSLLRLDGFYVKDETGYRLEELEHMNKLCQLRIKQLENVKDVEEACSAKLCDKRNLLDLSLEWSDVELRINGLDKKMLDDLSLNEKVFDNLQPHNKLKKLRISGYMGARSAIWMNNANLFSNLEYIQLDHCLQWQTLPPFRHFPVLKSLYLRNMQKVKSLGYKFLGEDCVFPSLEVLHIEKLEELEFWFDPAATPDYLFPCLIKLYLKDCPNLKELPYLPRNLKELEIDNIGWKALKWLQDNGSCKISIQNCCNKFIYRRKPGKLKATEIFQHVRSELTINDPSVLLMDPLKRITSLEKLTIKDNDELVSFPIEAGQWFENVSSSLSELYFDSLESLQFLPSCLKSLSSLKILRVHNVLQLQELPDLPPSLCELDFDSLKSLEALPSRLKSLSSLKILRVQNVPQLQELPDLPPSLCELYFDILKSLQSLPSCLGSLSSLEILRVYNVPQLQELPDLPPSLCELYFDSLESLQSLPSCLKSLSSLKILHVHNVPRLQELPDLPPSLKDLTIKKCHPELKERYEKSDRHKIAHIRHIDISNDQ